MIRSRPTTIELYSQAGFQAGEVEASRNLRAAVCNGTASAEDQLAYQPFAAAWSRYSELVSQRDQADAREATAPDPARHDADQDGGLGSALRRHRDGQPPPKVVIRPKMIRVDDGTGSLMDLPEQPEWPLYRSSSSSIGHQRIAASLAASTKR